MKVRHREAGDLEELIALAEAVRRLEGYPPQLPDIFPEAVMAWVAVQGETVVGHVALHPDSAAPVMALTTKATGWPTERLVVVARLLVAPAVRRRGIGRMLLDHAVVGAHTAGRWPVLDVGLPLRGAIAFYESCEWSRVGSVRFPFRDGTTLRQADSLVYLGPSPPGVICTPDM